MFEDTAKKIFKKAGVPVEGHPELFLQAVGILNSTMARLSASHAVGAISWKDRIETFDLQKQTLLEDLKGLAATGTLPYDEKTPEEEEE